MWCPTCKKKIVNKVLRNNGRIDAHCPCGYSAEGCANYIDPEEEMNEFIGDWKDEEVYTALKAMEASHHCDNNRKIFKGKSLYTIWRGEQGSAGVRSYLQLKNLIKKL